MSAKSDRRKRVNAFVVAASAAMFATAWVGVVRADQQAAADDATVAVVETASTTTAFPSATNAEATPAPRRTVIVRRSRAS